MGGHEYAENGAIWSQLVVLKKITNVKLPGSVADYAGMSVPINSLTLVSLATYLFSLSQHQS